MNFETNENFEKSLKSLKKKSKNIFSINFEDTTCSKQQENYIKWKMRSNTLVCNKKNHTPISSYTCLDC